MSNIQIVITHEMKERFFSYVDKLEGCWKWKGALGKGGYGRFNVHTGIVNAQRVSWVMHNDRIPDGMFVCHKCDNRQCTNPDHLFLGTRQDNINDMLYKKRGKHFLKNQYYGVKWEERKNKKGLPIKGRWRSFMCIKGKIKKIGCHTSVVDAARNYDRIAYIVYGERKKLNFPEEYSQVVE